MLSGHRDHSRHLNDVKGPPKGRPTSSKPEITEGVARSYDYAHENTKDPPKRRRRQRYRYRDNDRSQPV